MKLLTLDLLVRDRLDEIEAAVALAKYIEALDKTPIRKEGRFKLNVK